MTGSAATWSPYAVSGTSAMDTLIANACKLRTVLQTAEVSQAKKWQGVWIVVLRGGPRDDQLSSLLPRGNSANRFNMGNARPGTHPGCRVGNILLPNRCPHVTRKPRQNRGFGFLERFCEVPPAAHKTNHAARVKGDSISLAR